MQEEIWKNLPDLYTKIYQVSNLGNLRSLDFTFTHPGPGRMKGLVITRKGGPMKIKYSTKRPYGRITATLKNGKRVELLIHWIVAEAFLGPRPNGLWVLHKNGKSYENTEENLYYGTPSQNTFDGIKHGTIKCGEAHHKAKLTKEQVVEIFLSKERSCIVSKKYGVDAAIPRLIRTRKIWKSVTESLPVQDC